MRRVCTSAIQIWGANFWKWIHSCNLGGFVWYAESQLQSVAWKSLKTFVDSDVHCCDFFQSSWALQNCPEHLTCIKPGVISYRVKAARQQGDMPIHNFAMPGATGCGGLATKDDADLHLHQKSDGSTGSRLSALDPANFGAGLRKLWSQNVAWHFGHSNSLMQTASKFTVLSLLRRRNHRCWCCHNWCLFNLCVLARFYLQERPIQKTL